MIQPSTPSQREWDRAAAESLARSLERRRPGDLTRRERVDGILTAVALLCSIAIMAALIFALVSWLA